MIELSFSTLENEIPLLPAQTLSFLVACGQENWNWVWWLESSACRIEDLGYCKKKKLLFPLLNFLFICLMCVVIVALSCTCENT
jgi:hypothetical protein